MSARSVQAATVLARVHRVLADATRALKAEDYSKTDNWFARRIGVGREHFNLAKHGKTYLTWPQTVSWALLVGVDPMTWERMVVVSGQQNNEGRGDAE